ncbi:MAG: glycoside hydrolase family 2 TIM barrel-domain containing protein [Bacilli bacterium]|nr:glycoside hydrolase family 2 TIM barrel-domain containing protein [Bacilli bacterium]MDD4065375.1 glycoside hydrolase family 2 TIM barrel-domain containing protein [Bacilli bacterium]
MRKNLNYDWQFIPDFKEEYIGAKNISGTHRVNLPHTIKELPYNYFDEESYQTTATYLKIFRLSIASLNKVVRLHFEGVMNKCEVFINGEKAGEHQGGYTAFDVNISRFIMFDRDNVLLVKVDASEDPSIPPFGGVIDYLTYGGIYREVYLEVLEPEYLEYALISPIDNKEIEIQYKLRRPVDEYRLHYQVIDAGGQMVSDGEARYENNEGVVVKLPVPNAHLWDLDDPYLYQLKTELIIDHKVVDTRFDRFGMRTATFTPEGFYLNGRRVQLIGLNRHQAYPYVGYAMPKSQQRLDAYLLKDYLHCNIVRSSHYPQSQHFYDCLDEIGLLGFIEVPGWQHLGDDTWKKNLIKATEEMVIQYFNHPAIVIFGSRVDESVDDHALYTATYNKIREYDKYRAIGGVRNFANSELLEDVYTYNDFIHDGTNEGVTKPKKVIKDNVPYLITEHNGHMHPTKKFDPVPNRVDQALRHARVINDAMEYPQISGAIGWCFADYNTHKQFGSGDRICYHGVLDMYRLPKYAAYVYRSQTDEEPVLEVCSNLAIGDLDKMVQQPVVIFSNVDYIKLFKGEQEIGKILPDKEHYPHLKHAPFIVHDLVGDIMAKKEGIEASDGEVIKALMLQIASHGFDSISLLQKSKMLKLLKKYNLTVADATRLYSTYFTNLALDGADYYRFVGMKDEKEVISKSVGVPHDCKYQIAISEPQFEEEGTYDVMKIDVTKVDQFGNQVDYANDIIRISAMGAVENIGPNTASLIGGSLSFYVRSKGLRGTATIKIYAGDLLIREIATGVIRNEG